MSLPTCLSVRSTTRVARAVISGLLLVLLLLTAAPVMSSPPTFTGDVETDFDPQADGVVVVTDPGGQDVPIPSPPFDGPSGYDIDDVRFYYDRATDTLYVGINTFTISGDADNDGDPNSTSPELAEEEGRDEIDFASTESFGVILDTDNDGDGDVVVGVDCNFGIAGFGAYSFVGILHVPFCGFGPPLPAHSGTTTDPSTMGPDLEFTIPNFSGLPGLPYDPLSNPITIGILAFQGAFDDWPIGEDHVPDQAVLQPITFTHPALVVGRVFHDLNENGVKDGGEPGLPGITVELDADFSGGDGQLGTYDSLNSGLYGFYVDIPAFETASCALSVAPESLAGWSLTTPATVVVSGVMAGQTSAGHHFGLVPGPARVTGTVFSDLDGDGVMDGGEPGLVGVPVELDYSIAGGGSATLDATTDSSGDYDFELMLEEGETADFVVSVNPLAVTPAGATTPVTVLFDDVQPGERIDDVRFGFQYPTFETTVRGQVFYDADGNGISGGVLDGMGGVPVYVDVSIPGESDFTVSGVTGGDGIFDIIVPMNDGDTADLLIYVEDDDFPGVVFTTPQELVVDDVAPEAEVEAEFGFQSHRVPIFGDWNGDGVMTVGLFESSSSTFYFRNDNSDGPAEIAVSFGQPGDIPLAGDWNGDGKHGIGTYTPAESRFRVRNELSNGEPDHNFRFGPANLDPLVGDWNGDGIETVGLHDPFTRAFFLRDEHGGGAADYFYKFGARWTIPVAGDWNGDGTDTIGIYHPPEKTFFLANNHGGGIADYTFRFAGRHLYPVIGDWNNDGIETIGVYNAPLELFHLRDSNSSGQPDNSFEFTTNKWVPVYGDWNGDGTRTVGSYDPARARWLIRNENSSGHEEVVFEFGAPNQVPLVGDWNGNGVETVGFYNRATRFFHLRNSLGAGDSDLVFKYGGSNKEPVVGDWNSDGIDTIGIYDPGSGVFFLRDSNSGGSADHTAAFDGPLRTPLVGDWDGNGTDTIGTYDPDSCTYRLRNDNTTGDADATFVFGSSGCSPLVGDWDGDGYSTVGAYRATTGKHALRNFNTAGPADILLTFPIPFW